MMNLLKIKTCKYLWIALLLALAVNVYQYGSKSDPTQSNTQIDTVITVIYDSVSLIRAKAELNYLREELTQANGQIEYLSGKVGTVKTDTVIIGETRYEVPVFTASIDTTFEKGNYLTAKYEYPQNRFTILHRYSYDNSVIAPTVMEEEGVFTFNHGIQVGFGYGVNSRTFDTFVGYGFTLGLNL